MTENVAFLQYIKNVLLQPTDETFCWLATALPGPAVEWATAVRVRAIPLDLDGRLEDSSWARWATDLGCIDVQSGHTRANSKLVLAPVPSAVEHLKNTCEPHNRIGTKIGVYQHLPLICSNFIDREKNKFGGWQANNYIYIKCVKVRLWPSIHRVQIWVLDFFFIKHFFLFLKALEINLSAAKMRHTAKHTHKWDVATLL